MKIVVVIVGGEREREGGDIFDVIKIYLLVNK